MSLPSSRTPSYRHHKPTGLAVVTINGRDIYCGKFGSPESRAEYDRLLAEWLVNGRRLPTPPTVAGTDLSVNEMILAYLIFADGYYLKNGKPTTEPNNIRFALRPLRKLYGHTLARDFGPLALKAVRQAMIDSKLCRSEVNKRVRHVVRCFRWAVGEEIVPPSIHHGLKAVTGLRRGRSEARESEPVKPVPDAHVDAIRPYVSPQVWTMIELQRLTGMRPGEALIMRTCDLDMSAQLWIYKPSEHKTEHHGRDRFIYFGPQAQEIVRTWLRENPTEFLFRPAEAIERHRAKLRENRKTKVQPSQAARKPKRKPQRAPGKRYTKHSYGRAIKYGCKKASVPAWHPHQLRHNAATRLRKEFGLDTARAVLGHASASMTEVYAELDAGKASDAMSKVG